MMRITILCSDPNHPVMPYLERWRTEHGAAHDIRLVGKVADAGEGDLLFLVSCTEIVKPEVRARFRHALVLHASDLPEGRGWSPHIWSVLRGDESLTLSLLAAADPVDTGDIYRQEKIPLDGTELCDEINRKLFEAELRLMSWALAHAGDTPPRAQAGEASYWPRRTPEDSRIDPSLPLAQVFDRLRVADPIRYPAFFDYRGARYVLRLEKVETSHED